MGCYQAKLSKGAIRNGDYHNNAAMESFLSSVKTQRMGKKTYRMRNQVKVDVLDYIESLCKPARRHLTLVTSALSILNEKLGDPE
jgi:hypothetical protein